MMGKIIFSLIIKLVIVFLVLVSPIFASLTSEQENSNLRATVDKWHHVQKTIKSLNVFNHQCTENEKVLVHRDPCQIIYDLSASMNRHTRNLPLETALSMLALGAGRSSDFIKYLSENKDREMSKDFIRRKSFKRQIKNIDQMSQDVQQAIMQAEKEASTMNESDLVVVKNIHALKLEYARLDDKKMRLSEMFENIKKGIDLKNLEKNKINAPFWPLKLIQIALGAGVLAHEIYLCEKKSVSCIIYQILDLLNPIPITDMGDGTLTARYEDVPALIVLDVERKLITPQEACILVNEDKKLLQNFGIVKRLYDEAQHPFKGKLSIDGALKKKSESY